MAGLKLTDALWNIWHIMKIKNEANIVSMTWYLYKYITFIIYIVFEKNVKTMSMEKIVLDKNKTLSVTWK